jgi:uncharacterized protein (TIGR00266 family)
MQHEIMDDPDFAMLKITFDAPGEQLVAESGAMVAMDPAIQMTTSMRGGLMAAAKRKLLGGESLFQNTYDATAAGQTIFLAPAPEGDMRMRALEEGEVFFLNSGTYVAHAGERLDIDTKYGAGASGGGLGKGVRGLLSGTGLFVLKITGPGLVFFSSYGAVHEVDIPPDGYICDTGHVVAFTEGLSYDIRRFGGTKGLFFSGEGFICEFNGQGRLYMQTRNAPALAAFLEPFRRVQRNSND